MSFLLISSNTSGLPVASTEESLGKPEEWELGSAGISTDFGVEMGDLGPRTSMIAFCFSGPGYDR